MFLSPIETAHCCRNNPFDRVDTFVALGYWSLEKSMSRGRKKVKGGPHIPRLAVNCLLSTFYHPAPVHLFVVWIEMKRKGRRPFPRKPCAISLPYSLQIWAIPCLYSKLCFLPFGQISGLLVNHSKSSILPLNVPPNQEDRIQHLHRLQWSSGSLPYPEIHIPSDLVNLQKCNHEAKYAEIKSQIHQWDKLKLSCHDRYHLHLSSSPSFYISFRSSH